MSFGPRLRTRIRLDDDDDCDCPEATPLWREVLIACLPLAVTAFLELKIDEVKPPRKAAAKAAEDEPLLGEVEWEEVKPPRKRKPRKPPPETRH